MALIDDLRALLAQRPGSTTRELQQQLVSLGRPKPTRGDLNSLLYGHPKEFRAQGGPPPLWHLAGVGLEADPAASLSQRGSSAAPSTSHTRTRKAAAVRSSGAPVPPLRARPPKVDRPLIDAMSKAELITTICAELGVADVGIGPGSTEPKAVFTHVIDRLGLGIDTTLSKPELGEAIAKAARLPWHPSMDSRNSPSGGGDTVTADGLRQVLRAVWAIKDGSAAVPDVAEPEERRWSTDETSPIESEGPPDGAFGLVPLPAPPGGGTGLGGGGEGPVHAALKAYVKEDPFGAIGEHLTYLAEDLTDPAPQRLGDEISFVTGDRVDLLMRDEAGRLVVIEVEPDIGPSGHIGFHQAAKYWVLVAVANGLPLDAVRRVVVARTIDSALEAHYKSGYGIESFEVTVPPNWKE